MFFWPRCKQTNKQTSFFHMTLLTVEGKNAGVSVVFSIFLQSCRHRIVCRWEVNSALDRARRVLLGTTTSSLGTSTQANMVSKYSNMVWKYPTWEVHWRLLVLNIIAAVNMSFKSIITEHFKTINRMSC